MQVQLDHEEVQAALEPFARRVVELLREVQKQEMADRWLDARDAAHYAGCSLPSLHKATGRREVEFRQDKPGGKMWFRRIWIDQWRGL